MFSCDPKSISQEKQFGPKCNLIFACKINIHSFFDECNADVKHNSSHKIILKFRKLKDYYVVSYKFTLDYDLPKSPLLYIFNCFLFSNYSLFFSILFLFTIHNINIQG